MLFPTASEQTKTSIMSANEMEGTSVRGGLDHRGSDDSDDGSPQEERRGSEDSLAAEGISMEKQDVETKEKTAQSGKTRSPNSGERGGLSGRDGYSVVGGAGSGERRASSETPGAGISGGKTGSNISDNSPGAASLEQTANGMARTGSRGDADPEGVDDTDHGLPFVAPITLEVGQVMFAPAPPPVSTAMPVLRPRSRDGESAGGETQGDTVEDVNEKYYDAVQDRSMGASENGGNKDMATKPQYGNGEDADDEHVSSVSEDENGDEDGDENKREHPGDDETFPLRTYKYGKFQTTDAGDIDPFLDRLTERRLRLSSGGQDRLSTSSAGYDDGASSVVSDVYSPRHQRPPPDKNIGASEAEERAAQSYNRFKAGMPKFSSKAYSFSKRHPTSVTVATTTPLTFDHSPLMSPGSQTYPAKKTTETISENTTFENTTTAPEKDPPDDTPAPRVSYDDVKVDKSEGYFLDNYSDVCTWRQPVRYKPRLYLDGMLETDLDDLINGVDGDGLDKETRHRGDDVSDYGDNEEDELRKDDKDREEEGEGDDDDDDDDDDKTREMEVKKKEDENANEKVSVCVCVNAF